LHISFKDTTSCPAGWFGKSQNCFRFYQVESLLKQALANCSLENAYLIDPNNPSLNEFVDQLINDTGVLDNMGDFWTGVTTTTFGLTFVSANGKIISTEEMVPGSALDSQFAFDTVAKAWRSSTNINHTFVCQRDPGMLS